ncbi:MAG TPA: hypothetical protein VGK99_23760 [Acidobacteriota bacterium]|jgi:hypothetical protein
MQRKYFSLFVLIVLLVALSAFGADKSYSGMLMDKMCSASSGDAAKVAKHSKACALMDSCIASGYGIVIDGKFIKFDANGDKLVSEWLEKTDKTRELKIEVTGTMDGDILKVETLK